MAGEDRRPRSVWRRNGDLIVLREADSGEIEEYVVPAWVAAHVYSLGERELVSDAQRAAFEAAYTKHLARERVT